MVQMKIEDGLIEFWNYLEPFIRLMDVIAYDVINLDHIDVRFDCIGGLEAIKQALYELVILPLRRLELFSHVKLLGPQKCVFLYGPPGTGKTMLAKAIAKELRALFINVRISNLMSKWFGDAQKLGLSMSCDYRPHRLERLKEVIVGKKDFEQQMETIGRLGQHPNVVALWAYYYSKDEKLLVNDHFSSGSLATVLHANKTAGRTPLDWETRVKISLGEAKGVAHLHSSGGAKFTRGNIKSSNPSL